jgi:hypothetical protein
MREFTGSASWESNTGECVSLVYCFSTYTIVAMTLISFIFSSSLH